jgi:hypothetical protein
LLLLTLLANSHWLILWMLPGLLLSWSKSALLLLSWLLLLLACGS